MQNCMATYYTCVGLPDGANPIPGGGIATKYIMCLSDRVMDVKSCPNGNTYDPILRICTQTAEQGKPDFLTEMIAWQYGKYLARDAVVMM